MAQPIYYPDWATQNVTLPGTGKPNKVIPKETIRLVGMDFGQIMTCEELNWWLNNVGMWIRYFQDEFFPTLPNTYLPLVGTKLTLKGGATGTVTWNGKAAAELSVTITDNSHKHLSKDISDATDITPTPNVLVKRDNGGGMACGDLHVMSTSATDNATAFFENFSKRRIGSVDGSPQAGGVFGLYKINPETNGVTAKVEMFDAGYTLITNPRTSNGQESAGNALVRLDYLNSQITSLQTQITNVSNSVVRNFVSDIRLGAVGSSDARTNDVISAPSGYVLTGTHSNYNDDNWELDRVYYRPIQKFINGVWYTVGQV